MTPSEETEQDKAALIDKYKDALDQKIHEYSVFRVPIRGTNLDRRALAYARGQGLKEARKLLNELESEA